MMKRRSFLAMLGIGAGAATAGAKAAIPAVEAVEAAPLAVADTVATTAVTVPTYMVRMPVSVSLTQEQVDLCSAWNMSPVEYAKNLLDLKQEGKIEAEVNTSLEMEVSREMARKMEFDHQVAKVTASK